MKNTLYNRAGGGGGANLERGSVPIKPNWKKEDCMYPDLHLKCTHAHTLFKIYLYVFECLAYMYAPCVCARCGAGPEVTDSCACHCKSSQCSHCRATSPAPTKKQKQKQNKNTKFLQQQSKKKCQQWWSHPLERLGQEDHLSKRLVRPGRFCPILQKGDNM